MNYSTSWDHWVYVTVPFFIYLMAVLCLLVWGEHGEETNIVKVFFRRISWSLERLTGHPGWVMSGVLSGLTVLGVALVGLYWDVAFHIDLGRDKELFTPSHTMIVLGLGGLVYSAVVAVIFATVDRAPVGWRFAGLRIPRSAVVLAALGTGGVAAFPLDALWHEAYGIDVTLWSPTHLQLIAGGGLAPIALWLMLREGATEAKPRLFGRGISALVLGAVLTGLTAVQGEFDFGVPQFQVSYLPILIAVAAGFSLVVARVALGPGGALKAVVAFLILRGVVALLVAGALNHTVPRFPLYLASAAVVELAAWVLGTQRRLRLSLVAGVLVGTVGVVAELVWVQVSDWYGTVSATLPLTALLAVPASVGAAVVGTALARGVPDGRRVPLAAAALAGVAVVVALAVPLPRNVGPVEATIRTQPGGPTSNVQVQLQPPDAAEGHSLALVSWQGGGRVLSGLREVGPGSYVSARPVPVGGRWKSMLSLQRGDEVMAAPVYLPADPEIGAPEVPAVPERRERMVRNTQVYLRESHAGSAWVSTAAYAGLAVVVGAWIVLFAFAGKAGSRREEEGPVHQREGEVGANGHLDDWSLAHRRVLASRD